MPQILPKREDAVNIRTLREFCHEYQIFKCHKFQKYCECAILVVRLSYFFFLVFPLPFRIAVLESLPSSSLCVWPRRLFPGLLLDVQPGPSRQRGRLPTHAEHHRATGRRQPPSHCEHLHLPTLHPAVFLPHCPPHETPSRHQDKVVWVRVVTIEMQW